MKKVFLTLMSVMALNVFTYAQSTVWSFDKAHATLGFAVDHMVVSEVQGKFGEFTINLKADKADFTDAKFDATIQVKSINTENADRDKHLQGADFFDAAKFPTIEFKGFELKKVDGNKYKAVGDLTMKGKTKRVEFDVKFGGIVTNPYSKKATTGFKITGVINREDFELKYNSVLDNGGLALGKEVTFNGAFEFTK